MNDVSRLNFIQRVIIRMMALGCTLAILYLTLAPSKGTPVETISDFTMGGDAGDAILHFLIFVIHTSLWVLALRDLGEERSRQYALVLGLLLALGTETAQIFLPTRGAILMDYTANVIGVVFTVWWWRKLSEHN